MLRIITLLCLTAISMLASQKIVTAHYDVTFGIFGKMGESRAILRIEDGRYTIDIDAYATGLAKKLSGNRRERHHSEGIVRDGLLIAKRYDVIRSYGNKKIVKSYRFDHRGHRIRKTYEKYRNGKRYTFEKSVLPYFTTEDLLTLYFNLDKRIDKYKPGIYRFKAAGAERQGGMVEIIVPDAKHKREYIDLLGKGADWYATAIIHQKIFASETGKLKLAVGKEGIAQKAILEDVALFGDVVATRKK